MALRQTGSDLNQPKVTPQLNENAQWIVVSKQVSGVSKQKHMGFYNASTGDIQVFRSDVVKKRNRVA
jgi:hypothetical protein